VKKKDTKMRIRLLNKKSHFDCLNLIVATTCIALFIGCSFQAGRAAKDFLEIHYQLDRQEGIVPSYQTVIWLEDENGNYVTSLLVSEWLSYEGYSNPTVCPDWSKVSDWKNASEKEVHAVTAATPPIGSNVLRIDCKKANLPPGKYRYCVQTHIMGNYNVLYCGRIEIDGQEDESTAKVTYTPGRRPAAAEILRNVKAKYCPRLKKEDGKK